MGDAQSIRELIVPDDAIRAECFPANSRTIDSVPDASPTWYQLLVVFPRFRSGSSSTEASAEAVPGRREQAVFQRLPHQTNIRVEWKHYDERLQAGSYANVHSAERPPECRHACNTAEGSQIQGEPGPTGVDSCDTKFEETEGGAGSGIPYREACSKHSSPSDSESRRACEASGGCSSNGSGVVIYAKEACQDAGIRRASARAKDIPVTDTDTDITEDDTIHVTYALTEELG